MFNSSCPQCNSPSYTGLVQVECSNKACKLYAKPRTQVIEQEDGLDDLILEYIKNNCLCSAVANPPCFLCSSSKAEIIRCMNC